jgi:hypothetical protein
LSCRKIDVFTHILPEKYLDALSLRRLMDAATEALNARRRLSDLDIRFRIMDLNEGYAQILNIAGPPVEDVANPTVAAELAKIANDEMAELVSEISGKVFSGSCLSADEQYEGRCQGSRQSDN